MSRNVLKVLLIICIWVAFTAADDDSIVEQHLEPLNQPAYTLNTFLYEGIYVSFQSLLLEKDQVQYLQASFPEPRIMLKPIESIESRKLSSFLVLRPLSFGENLNLSSQTECFSFQSAVYPNMYLYRSNNERDNPGFVILKTLSMESSVEDRNYASFCVKYSARNDSPLREVYLQSYDNSLVVFTTESAIAYGDFHQQVWRGIPYQIDILNTRFIVQDGLFNGKCNGVENDCECLNPGFSGITCRAKTCKTQKEDNENECLDRGICNESTNTCSCQGDYFGKICDRLKCNKHTGYICGNAEICDYFSGKCFCDNGLWGSACQMKSCPANDKGIMCFGNGTCQPDGMCTCYSDYKGSDCSVAVSNVLQSRFNNDIALSHNFNFLGLKSDVFALIGMGLNWKVNCSKANRFVATKDIIIEDPGMKEVYSSVNEEGSPTSDTLQSLYRLNVNISTSKLARFYSTAAAKVLIGSGKESNVELLFATGDVGGWKFQATAYNRALNIMGLASSVPQLVLCNLRQGALGINNTSPAFAIDVLSSSRGNGIKFSGNTDKLDGMVDAYLILESAKDAGGRGILLPHRAPMNSASKASWYVGVPVDGKGFLIGASSQHQIEKPDGPYVRGNSLLFILEDGRVGLNSTSPISQLDIGTTGDWSAINIRSGDLTMAAGLGIRMGAGDVIRGTRKQIYVGENCKNSRKLILQVGEYQPIIIDATTGYVGLNTAVPLAQLHVTGDVIIENGLLRIVRKGGSVNEVLTLESQVTTPPIISLTHNKIKWIDIYAGKVTATVAGTFIKMYSDSTFNNNLYIQGGGVAINTNPEDDTILSIGGNILLRDNFKIKFFSNGNGASISESGGLRINSIIQGNAYYLSLYHYFHNIEDGNVNVVLKTTEKGYSRLDVVSGVKVWTFITAAGSSTAVGNLSPGALELRMANKVPVLTFLDGGSIAGNIGINMDRPKEQFHVNGRTLVTNSQDSSSVVINAIKSKKASMALLSDNIGWKVGMSGVGLNTIPANGMTFSYGNNDASLILTQEGRFGINVSSINATINPNLHVNGPSLFQTSSASMIVISTIGDAKRPGFAFFSFSGARVSDLVAVPTGAAFTRGFLGIGMEAPEAPLHIYDLKNSAIRLSNTADISKIAEWKFINDDMTFGTNSVNNMNFKVGGKNVLTITKDGLVGLNYDSKSLIRNQFQLKERTHINELNGSTYLTSNGWFDGVKFKYTVNSGASGIRMLTDGSIAMYTASGGTVDQEITGWKYPVLRIDSQGFLSVGSILATTAETPLHILDCRPGTLANHGAHMIGISPDKNISSDCEGIMARRNGKVSDLQLNRYGGIVRLYGGSALVNQVVFNSDGSLGLGTDSPSGKLHLTNGAEQFVKLNFGEGENGIAQIQYIKNGIALGFEVGDKAKKAKWDTVVITNTGSVNVNGPITIKGFTNINGPLFVNGRDIVAGQAQAAQAQSSTTKEVQTLAEELITMKEAMSDLVKKMNSLLIRKGL